MDVKYVPSHCIVNGEKYYVFSGKDECTRWTYREMFAEHNSYIRLRVMKVSLAEVSRLWYNHISKFV